MAGRAFALILALGAIATPIAVLADGGTVVKLKGNASVERGGKRIPVAESSALYSGDVLNVSGGSNVQLHFSDDSVFIVPGPTKLKVDEFSMPSGGRPGKAIYTLVDGAVRAITGSVKGTQGQYEMRTDEGTITVAGSSYTAMRCNAACSQHHPAGLYVRGESGVVTVTGKGGSLALQPNQTAFLSASGALQLVKISPINESGMTDSFAAAVQFNVDVHPPRVEPENPASPS